MVNQTNAFLQGPATEADKLGELKEGVREGKFLEVRLLNYTKGGDPFYNTLKCHPLRDANGKLTHYCGVLEGEPVPEGQVPKRTTQPLLPAVAVSRTSDEGSGFSNFSVSVDKTADVSPSSHASVSYQRRLVTVRTPSMDRVLLERAPSSHRS